MESQLTLVNPAPLSLVFNETNIANAVLYADSQPLYKISPGETSTSTIIFDALTDCVLCSIRKREIFPDTISFVHRNGGKPIKVKEWLRPEMLPDGSWAHMLNADTASYFWQRKKKNCWSLYRNDDCVMPVAQVKISSRSSTPVIKVKPVPDTDRDEIIASYIYLEQKIRTLEKTKQKFFSGGALHKQGYFY